MKKMPVIFLVLLSLLLTASALLPAAADIDWWAFGGGGSSVSQGARTLDSVVGQGMVGSERGAGKDLCSGYLCSSAGFTLFLPLATRNTP
jgi:hypothetical protein